MWVQLHSLLFALQLLSSFQSSYANGESANALSCLEKGFGEGLLCSSCDKLAAAVGAAGLSLVEDCQVCCSADKDDTVGYVSAKLVVCS